MRYGRDEDQWDALVTEGRAFLEERARLQRLTNYSEVNDRLAKRTGQPPFDFTQDAERTALGEVLGRITEETFPQTKVMLSSLVVYINENDAGDGFYSLAQRLGLLAHGAGPEARLDFWATQVKAVYAFFG